MFTWCRWSRDNEIRSAEGTKHDMWIMMLFYCTARATLSTCRKSCSTNMVTVSLNWLKWPGWDRLQPSLRHVLNCGSLFLMCKLYTVNYCKTHQSWRGMASVHVVVIVLYASVLVVAKWIHSFTCRSLVGTVGKNIHLYGFKICNIQCAKYSRPVWPAHHHGRTRTHQHINEQRLSQF